MSLGSFFKISIRWAIVMEPRTGFLSSEYSCCGVIMLGAAEVLPSTLRPLISFLFILGVSFHEVRFYRCFFGLRGDADLTAEDFLGI